MTMEVITAVYPPQRTHGLWWCAVYTSLTALTRQEPLMDGLVAVFYFLKSDTQRNPQMFLAIHKRSSFKAQSHLYLQ